MAYANIIVDISIEKLDRPFTYEIPRKMEEQVAVGSMVTIPFGKGNRLLKGFVIGINEKFSNPEGYEVKQIQEVLEGGITTQLIQLASYMKQQYGGTLNQALKVVFPKKKQTKIKETKQVELLLEEERAKAILQVYDKKHAVAKQRLLTALMEEKVLEMSVITGKLNVTAATVKGFEKEGYVRISSQRVFRNPLPQQGGGQYRPTLNVEQENVVNSIAKDYQEGIRKTYLLQGVTGSGKTEVYMELIEQVVQDGKQAIVLIPEIALTYQTMTRFFHRFGQRVSILHSKLSDGERLDQLERAQNGEIDIMIGPRSALFTPFPNLGLIIIDEEHESSYKSETVPKYHTREIAIYRAKQIGAYVVLGSATPSVESFYKAEKREYGYFQLTKRYNEKELPEAQIVDLREELRSGNRSMFSGKLSELIEDRLNKHQQIMLFINRRGVAGFISCRSCGEVMKCPHCDVSLTQHQDGTLKCHYCGYVTPMVNHCPSCGSKYIGGFKVGTQKIEDSLKEKYPQARVLRMDADTTRNKDGYEKILAAFANQEADILVGTQMIVKGHDFPNVTLVGVLAADLSLHMSDFHASERTFQLLTQAAGRAGRGEKEGTVVIQTYSPEHFAIETAKLQNYDAFYSEEIRYRKLLSYPPCGHLLMVLVSSEKEKLANGLAKDLASHVKTYLEQNQNQRENRIAVMGPTDAKIKKVQDIYRKVIYIKAKTYEGLVEVKNELERYREETGYQDGTVQFDFDPLNSL